MTFLLSLVQQVFPEASNSHQLNAQQVHMKTKGNYDYTCWVTINTGVDSAWVISTMEGAIFGTRTFNISQGSHVHANTETLAKQGSPEESCASPISLK